MTTYTVLIPPGARQDRLTEDALAEAVFVKDGFCWPAIFFAIPWLLFRRLWLVLLLYLIAVIVIEAGAQLIAGAAPGVIGTAFALLFAFEANELRRWTLERRGWQTVGFVEGRSVIEAEARFFTGVAARAALATATPPAPQEPHPTPPTTPVPSRAPRIGGPKVIGFSSTSPATKAFS